MPSVIDQYSFKLAMCPTVVLEKQDEAETRSTIHYRIFFSPHDKICLQFLKTEHCTEVGFDLGSREAIAAGIDIDAGEASGRKGVDADVAFHDDHDATPPTGTPDAVGRRPMHRRFGQFPHAESFWQFIKTLLNQFTIPEFFARPTVSVDHQVLAEMLAAGWRNVGQADISVGALSRR